jgi:pyridoxamine 5'-phosphate oxidase family protein
LATLASDGSPQTRPVGFFLNEELGTIDIGGHNLGQSQKFRNIQRDGRVAFVVDDLASIDPWSPRGIEIRGEAEAIVDAEPSRPGFSSELIRIRPNRLLSWGLESDAFAPPLARNIKSV